MFERACAAAQYGGNQICDLSMSEDTLEATFVDDQECYLGMMKNLVSVEIDR